MIVTSHTWLEDLLSQLLNSLTSEPSSHRGLASNNNDKLLKCVMLSVERLPICWVSRRKFIKFVVVTTAAARLSHV